MTDIKVDPYQMEKILQMIEAQDKEIVELQRKIEILSEHNARLTKAVQSSGLLDWWTAYNCRGYHS